MIKILEMKSYTNSKFTNAKCFTIRVFNDFEGFLVHRKICKVFSSKKICFLYVGTMQMLDARHIELFSSEGFQDGTWEFELIGSHKIEKNVQGASAAIFDVKHLKDSQSAGKSPYPMPV